MLNNTSNLPQMPRVVSAMRPTGNLHLGNYHGALKNWLSLQSSADCLFFVADWHALTTDYADSSKLRSNTFSMLVDWLACGLDPQQATIFVQSQVKEHCELHLLLSMLTPLGWLERVPTYKDQQQKLAHKELNTYGFLGYPVLQTADVLLYKGELVPVGEDQVAHLEVSREICRRFNSLYGKGNIILPEPKPLLTKVTKMPGLDGQKMSKSYNNTIELREAPSSIEKKIKTMPTDPKRIKRTDCGNPDNCPVGDLHKIYSTAETLEWVYEGCTNATIGCIDCKATLAANIIKELQPIQERAQQLLANPKKIDIIIEEGSEKARHIALATINEIKEHVGLY